MNSGSCKGKAATYQARPRFLMRGERNMDQQMDAAVRFLWHDGQGSLRMGVGATRDLSRHGIFVRTDESPAPGAEVQVLVDLPASDRTREGRLMGKGVAVLRERKNGQVAGFAAAVLFQPGWAGSLADGISFELDSEVGLRGLEASECDTTVPATWIPEMAINMVPGAVASATEAEVAK